VGSIIQIFKDFFLLFTTIYIVYWVLKDYNKGLNIYLYFFAIIVLLGLNRVMYFEKIILPLVIWISIYKKNSQLIKINILYVALFIYTFLITYVHGLSMIDDYSEGIYLFGFCLLIFSNYLFKKENNALSIVFFVWLITIGYALSFIIFGDHLFSIANINSTDRRMILNTGIVSSTDIGVDLNYFACGQSLGAIITLNFIYYRKYLIDLFKLPVYVENIVKNNLFTTILYLLFVLETWFVFRGLSRGGLLVLLAGVITFMIIQKKIKFLLYGCLFLLVSYLILVKVGIIALFVERMLNDQSGSSGRDLIWIGVFNAMKSHGGYLQIIFGSGNGWPWWKFWHQSFFDQGLMPSTHNQFISIWINFGIVGLTLFFIPIIIGIRNCLKNRNPINNIRIVLFVCVFVESLSLEPFVFARYIWFLLALATTYTPNIKKSIKGFSVKRDNKNPIDEIYN